MKDSNNVEKDDIFTGPHSFEMEGWISTAPFERLLNMEIAEAADGKAVLSMPFVVDLAQGAGIMHGGALISLADTAVVMAIKSLLDPKTHFGTISVEARFLYPVKQGVITAKAQVFEQTGRVLRGKAVLYNEQGRPVMEFLSTFKIAKDSEIRAVSFGKDTDL